MKTIVATLAAPSSPLYSQGVRVGSHVYVSGMTGTDVATGALAGPSIQEQTRQALANCLTIVEASGGGKPDIVQVTVLLAHPDDFAGMNEAYGQFFTSEPPARAVAKLGVDIPDVLVSMMMTAYTEPRP
jgi:2-iminobutanoate/2-iminopropanoate deaminase